MLAHPAGDMRGDDVTVFQLHPKHGVGQGVDHGSLHLNMVFFGQSFNPFGNAGDLRRANIAKIPRRGNTI